MPSFKPSPTPEGVSDLLEHERKYTALADALDAQVMAMLGDPKSPPMVISRAKELALASVRARRCAAELSKYRFDIDHDHWLLDEHRSLRGERGPRQPLRRKSS